jgi:hypothetical protein
VEKEAFGEDRLCSVLAAQLSNDSFGLVFLACAIPAQSVLTIVSNTEARGAWVDELFMTASRRGKVSGRDGSIRPKVLRANKALKFCVLQ